MNKNKPMANKFLGRIWQDIDSHLHRKRLKNVKSNMKIMMQEPIQMEYYKKRKASMVY